MGSTAAVSAPGVAPDVCLVTLPYASINRPSLALGLLKAVLEKGGIRAAVLYPNLWFAARTGLRLYHLAASQAPKEMLLGEWSFAAAAFPEAERDDEEYLLRVARAHRRIAGYHRSDREAEILVGDLRALRGAAGAAIGEAAERALATGARIVGCTSTFEQHVASLALLRRIRTLDPSVVTLLGGANCEGEMGRATHRSFPWVDFVVAGEADGVVVDLVRAALDRGRDVDPAVLPAGIYSPRHRTPARRDGAGTAEAGSGAGEARAAASRPLFRDLDALPLPDFGDYFAALGRTPFAGSVRSGLPLETSRGCWWGAIRHCTFCGLNGASMAFRSKSPRRVLEEIRTLGARYGIARFETVDNILDMGYFQDVLPALAADGGERRIFYEVKSNLRRPQVELLHRAGVRWLQPGIESLHSAVLQRMEKGVQAWQNLQLLRACRDLGVRLSWNLLWGFPGEEDAWYGEMAALLPALEHLQPPSALVRVRFDRHSPYHQRPADFGLSLRPVPAMSFVYPLAECELADLAYYFAADGRPDPFADGLADPTAGRPAVAELRDGVAAWRSAFWRASPPLLQLWDEGHRLRGLDTRSCTRGAAFELAGLDRDLYRLAEEAPLAASLPERLAAAPEALEASVARLLDLRLVVSIDRRLVALGTKPGLPPLPSFEEFPGGLVQEGPMQWV